MKFDSLHLKRALSAALFVLLLSVVGTKNALAQNQVAVLQHNDTIKAYYGIDALVQAHAEAADGDTITLSSGNFHSCDITKAITLHGAGCASDTLGIAPTYISNNCTINIQNQSDCLTIQGVFFQNTVSYGHLYHADFIKCVIGALNHSVSQHLENLRIINCLIGTANISPSIYDGVSIINSAIGGLESPTNYTVSLFNSYFGTYGSTSTTKNLYLYNCIVRINYNTHQLANSYAYNCIEIGSVFYNSVQTFNCMHAETFSEVFETFDGTFSFNSDFHLNEEIANTFLGTDGREVGIYGGAMPYAPRPTYMRPYRCGVSGNTTTDGYLNVEVEVAPDE
ncbi:MAG: hypothetical protein MJZ20_14570 [Bacteroidaceae bacterium]|nr:hypothetical protein [Bacteroidaceae bacterium]